MTDQQPEETPTTQTTTTTTSTEKPSTVFVEGARGLLVMVALIGTIALAWKYPEALTPALVVLSGTVAGYFGVSQSNPKRPG